MGRSWVSPIRNVLMTAAVTAGVLVTVGVASDPPYAHAASHHHGDHAASFGKPGDPTKANRTIRVVARGLEFSIAELRVRAGETIRFIVSNESELLHDFTLGDAATQKAHREEMAKRLQEHGTTMPHPMKDDPNAVLLQPGETKELVWTFTQPGTIEFACNVPGHYEAGMRGLIVIVADSRVLPSTGSPARTVEYDLMLDEKIVNFTGRKRPAMAINGAIPGPLLRLSEGEAATIRVTNRLAEPASIHWHGVLVPAGMDGVPGLSFDGIAPGETFTYRFTVKQSGTYWYHSHSGLQEQSGVYGPLIVEPAEPDPYRYDRDYVIMLSDWIDENPHRVLLNLKKRSDYYNWNKRTIFDFFRDVREKGWDATLADRRYWGRMRMDPTDIADVTGYTFLVNGQPPEANWTALFKPGERVRLRFINGAAMSIFDVRIPGLPMQVVQADGQNVVPVLVEEFRIAPGETYDVIVEPKEERGYTIFAESMDRSGYARATLAPRAGMSAEIPPMRPRPVLTPMAMGHGDMGHGPSPSPSAMSQEMPQSPGRTVDETQQTGMGHGGHQMPPGQGSSPMGKGHGGMAMHGSPKTLRYDDLRAVIPNYDTRPPQREILVRLTGNMERYFWSINDKKFSEAEPIRLRYGERVRIKFVNETMMNHPMHLHGMWMELENGNGSHNPRKHTINVPPGETIYVDVSADALGQWAFHCHLLYHMDTGMFRTVIVERA